MEETEHEETPTTEVNVEVTPAEEPADPPQEHTTVVVSDSGDSGIHPALAAFMADQSAFNAQIMARLDTTEVVASDAAITADNAAGTVEGAIAEVEAIGSQVTAVVAESQEPTTPDNDIAPKHAQHGWYRKRGRGHNS